MKKITIYYSTIVSSPLIISGFGTHINSGQNPFQNLNGACHELAQKLFRTYPNPLVIITFLYFSGTYLIKRTRAAIAKGTGLLFIAMVFYYSFSTYSIAFLLIGFKEQLPISTAVLFILLYAFTKLKVFNRIRNTGLFPKTGFNSLPYLKTLNKNYQD